jgi:hypothetical protein
MHGPNKELYNLSRDAYAQHNFLCSFVASGLPHLLYDLYDIKHMEQDVFQPGTTKLRQRSGARGSVVG